MSVIETAALGLVWFGVAVTGVIASICLYNPTAGLAKLNHELDQLPNVMLGRYIAIFGFSFFAAYYADFIVLIAWLTAASFMALFDAALYARQNKPYGTHLTAGILTVIAIILIVAAIFSNGSL